MKQFISDGFVELLSFLATLVGSILFSATGLLGEQAGITNVLSGNIVFGTWELYMGTVALGVGIYLLGIKQVIPRAQRVLGD